ncbi:MAG: integration host factor subunit beta [Spirochaetaceae bacterium]|nr:MAG: integration host factor subunit beta [Spirochaetaceae bacterium]
MASSKLTKAEIVEEIAESTGLSKKDIHTVVDLFFSQVKNALLDDKVIEFRGFGTFEIRTRKGRERARNPKTGETVSVQDHGVVVFRPGKELKEASWELRAGQGESKKNT